MDALLFFLLLAVMAGVALGCGVVFCGLPRRRNVRLVLIGALIGLGSLVLLLVSVMAVPFVVPPAPL
jgi:hypothetical protein